MKTEAHASPTDACVEQLWNEAQLAEPVRTPAWRLWTYREPAIILGCSQGRLLGAAPDDADIALLVRGAGGGAVLAGPWMLGLSVVLPTQHALAVPGIVASYRWLGELLAALLQDAGVAARALPADEARAAARPAALAWACFGGLSPWEVLADGRKIAGMAQVRRRHGVLWVAGLLLDAPDWSLLCAPLGHGAEMASALAGVTTSWAGQCARRPTTQAITAELDARLQAALTPPEPADAAPAVLTHSPPGRVFVAA